MTKVFKIFQNVPRSLFDYERIAFEEPFPEERELEEEKAVTPEMILAEARREAEQKTQEAYGEGMHRGLEAGEAQFQESVAEAAEMLERAAAAMQEAHEAFLKSLEPQVVALATAIAERILRREARLDPELVHTSARKALEHLTDRERLTIHVNPEDLEALRAQKVALLENFDGVREINIQPDPSISPGGCVVESELMQVDARLESQFEEILRVLEEAPPQPQAE